MPDLLPERQMARDPDRIVVLTEEGLDNDILSERATFLARSLMPKVTGHAANTLQAIHGDDFFGIYFPDRKVWFLEQGTRPFTMHSLAGKVIPMWIDDPTGIERHRNPKAKTRRTVDGRLQVLIFRRAALKGQRRMASRKAPDGTLARVSVPASYPGAPGRIARREASKPHTRGGAVGGQVARGNVGVRWRNPGIAGRQFLNAAIAETAWSAGLNPPAAHLVDAVALYALIRS